MFFPPTILLPGPTPVPEAVEKAMLTAMSDHRGSVFTPVAQRVRQKLAATFHLPQDGRIAILPATGTGGLEASIKNFFSPGDAVLAVLTGAFGERFASIAQSTNLHLDTVVVPWGEAFDPDTLIEKCRKTPYKGILVTHNETSTSVLNPVKELGLKLHQLSSPPLLVVDSISAIPSVPFHMDQWYIDVAIAASQKGFMCPPGLAFVGASHRAIDRMPQTPSGSSYFDLKPYFAEQFPYTPAVSLWYGLDAALDLLAEEGEPARFSRHRLLSDMARGWGLTAGLVPIVESHVIASPTVTALRVTEPLTPATIRGRASDMGLQIAGGMGEWHHDAVRIGHVGYLSPAELFKGLALLSHLIPQSENALLSSWNIWHQAATPF